MHSQHFSRFLEVSLFGLLFFFFAVYSAFAECRTEDPPVKLEIKLYAAEPSCNKGSASAATSIEPNCDFNFDITAKAANNCLNDGSKNPTVDAPGLQKVTRGNNPFNPWFRGPAGTYTATARLDNLTSPPLTFTIGTGGTNPGTGPGKTQPVDEQYCSYKEKDTVICIPSSLNDESCKETPECKGKTCTRVGSELCAAGGPAFDKPLPIPVRRPAELGPLIGNFYIWSIGIVGLLVFLVFFQAGFTWLVTAAGDPGKIRLSQDRMWNAVLGAILLFSAYVILRTINPDLVGQGAFMPPLPPSGGTSSVGAPANPLPVANPK